MFRNILFYESLTNWMRPVIAAVLNSCPMSSLVFLLSLLWGAVGALCCFHLSSFPPTFSDSNTCFPLEDHPPPGRDVVGRSWWRLACVQFKLYALPGSGSPLRHLCLWNPDRSNHQWKTMALPGKRYLLLSWSGQSSLREETCYIFGEKNLVS